MYSKLLKQLSNTLYENKYLIRILIWDDQNNKLVGVLIIRPDNIY